MQRVAAVRLRRSTRRATDARRTATGRSSRERCSALEYGTPTVCDRYPTTCRSYRPSRVHVARVASCSICAGVLAAERVADASATARSRCGSCTTAQLRAAARRFASAARATSRAQRGRRVRRVRRCADSRVCATAATMSIAVDGTARVLRAHGRRGVERARWPSPHSSSDAFQRALELAPARAPSAGCATRAVRRRVELRDPRARASLSSIRRFERPESPPRALHTRRCAVRSASASSRASRPRAASSSSSRAPGAALLPLSATHRRGVRALGGHDFPLGEVAVEVGDVPLVQNPHPRRQRAKQLAVVAHEQHGAVVLARSRPRAPRSTRRRGGSSARRESSRFARLSISIASATRARSPPESVSARRCTSSPEKPKRPRCP